MGFTHPNLSNQIPDKIDVEKHASLVQAGLVKTPSFYGDNSLTAMHSLFKSAVDVGLKNSIYRHNKDTLVEERDNNSGYMLTKKEFAVLEKVARYISRASSIPYDTMVDFLTILCFIDNIVDMRKIAEATQISELDDPNIIRNPLLILNINELVKLAFVANAVDGLINMFRKYYQTSNNIQNRSNDEDSKSILNSISSLLSGFSGSIQSITTRIETNDMGNFLSELITGNRVPTNVIAKNPNLQAPSYAGKAYFGEQPTSIANVDVDQLFAKSIAVFPKPSSGNGATSFTMQNFKSFSSAMPLENFVSKIITGNVEIKTQRKRDHISKYLEKISHFTGASRTETVEVNRADNAIPIQMALSTTFSGFDKMVFSTKTFSEGWINSQQAASYCYLQDPGFMEIARTIL